MKKDESSIRVMNRLWRSMNLDSERGKKNQEKVNEGDDFQLEKNQIENELKKNLRTRKAHDDRNHRITMRVMVSALIPY
ncbi:BnaC05g08930D [Brassica napus]|uniref:BnaC05g08930D protein n=1 Tax=Brassica napus TaxID=3708 RepID=A0A078G1M2_BRANA|nr:BnaC05g08930D [Brassica napus]